VELEKEIASIKNYLELEKIRYGEKAAINFSYEAEDSSNYFIPPLIFIPFLENAFKHGLSNSIQMGYVNVKLNIQNNTLHFEIENSKSNEIKDDRYFKGGIGLNNVKRRLELIFGQKYSLKINDSEDKFIVSLHLSLNENFKLA
jgi:LytS/YehU family sensor histidine kinase